MTYSLASQYPVNITRLYDRLVFPKHCFSAGSSLQLMDNLYAFDLGGYLDWFRPSDSFFVERRLSMGLQSSNEPTANKPTAGIGAHNMECDFVDTGLHVPSFRSDIFVSSKDGNGSLRANLFELTADYIIPDVNLDPAEIHVMTKSVSMTEIYFTTVRSSAVIPKFLLWLQEKVRYMTFKK